MAISRRTSRQIDVAGDTSSNPDSLHKQHVFHQEDVVLEESAHSAAERGHLATDKYGHSLVQFDPVAEAKLRRKIDLMIIPTVAVLYLFCFIDRANIGNAKLAGFEKELGLIGYDYNKVLSFFYISYILAEIPSNMLCKRIGPGWFIPFISLMFGICSIATAFVHNFAQVAAVRFLLGIFEAGMLPGIAYYLSRWYRRSELAWRLGLYVVMAPLAGGFGGLLASGILKLNSFGSLHTWRMIFGIEGIITCVVSVIAFFTLTDRPATARWLTQEEKDLAIARVKSERVGTTEVLDKIDLKKFLQGIRNPTVLATALMFLLDNVTVQGFAFFAPSIVRTIYPKATVVSQQLHTVPPYITGAFFTLLAPFLSTKLDKRNVFITWATIPVIVGYVLFLASTKAMVRYGATFLITMGAFVAGSLANAQASAAVVSDSSRSVAIGVNVMGGNIGGLIATWSFLPFDAPNYRIGNGLNLGVTILILCVGLSLQFWMRADNKRRETLNVDEVLAGKSEKEIQDLDWKHPSFRWKP